MKKIMMIFLMGGVLISPPALRAADYFSMLQSTVPSVRRDAVNKIGSERNPEWIDRLGGILRGDGNFTVRAAAAEALGNIRSRAAAPHLIAGLKDKERNVKASVLVSMGYIRSSETVDPLIKFAKAEKDEGLKVSALNVLGVIGDPAALGILHDSLSSSSTPRVRQIAAQSLGRLRNEESVKALVGVIGDKDKNLRLQAARALGEIGSSEALKPLSRQLGRESDTEVLVALAHALGQLGNQDGLDIVLNATRSDNNSLKRSALRALGAIGAQTPAVESAILEAMRNENPAVQRDAEIAASFLNIDLPFSAE
ncbi:MAG: HEAT repeat domain-containing protein [Elusimicrobia bacterium]|nr:HEAT repeat domain-containing protein [Elusimicrobiota bacterium]